MPDITSKRLAELLGKELAHDDYLAATKAVRALTAAVDLEAGGIRVHGCIPYQRPQDRAIYARGYHDCLTDFAQAILDAGEERRRLGKPRLPDAPAPRADAVVVGG